MLPDRKKYTYRFAVEELKCLVVGMNQTFDPSTLVTDFEPSLAEAVSSEVISSSLHKEVYFKDSISI